MFAIQDLHVKQIVRLSPPRVIKAECPATSECHATVAHARERVQQILGKSDPRMLLVVGPCSIHDVKGALDYARRLVQLRRELSDHFEIIMRVYLEKPRTTVGWKGLINDPHLDNSHDIETGLKLARRLLIDITSMGLPTATEFLDTIIPQYLDDLVSWTAIGARTTESQPHREMASGLSMPVGFKNATDGSLQVAIDAVGAAMHPHNFIGIDQDGVTAIVRTTGNPATHIVLRGGRQCVNYDPASIKGAETKLVSHKLPAVLMVDCSHANSGKQFARQEEAWRSVIGQRIAGTGSLVGAMLESYIDEGAQPIPQDPAKLKYGVSITDGCISWETTERLLRWGHQQLAGTI